MIFFMVQTKKYCYKNFTKGTLPAGSNGGSFVFLSPAPKILVLQNEDFSFVSVGHNIILSAAKISFLIYSDTNE